MKNNKNIVWIVWVGAIPNYFNSLINAQIEQMEWIEKGYDDIIIESIDDYNKRTKSFGRLNTEH